MCIFPQKQLDLHKSISDGIVYGWSLEKSILAHCPLLVLSTPQPQIKELINNVSKETVRVIENLQLDPASYLNSVNSVLVKWVGTREWVGNNVVYSLDLFKPTGACSVLLSSSPRIGEGPGLETQGGSTLFHKYCFPNLHWTFFSTIHSTTPPPSYSCDGNCTMLKTFTDLKSQMHPAPAWETGMQPNRHIMFIAMFKVS